MRLENQGLSLWYGTSDARGPESLVPAGESVPVMVGLSPLDASNQVDVHYRINGGAVATVSAQWFRNDQTGAAQYFVARLPALQPNDQVEYWATGICAGKCVPARDDDDTAILSFRVGEPANDSPAQPPNPTEPASTPPTAPAPRSSSSGEASRSNHGADDPSGAQNPTHRTLPAEEAPPLPDPEEDPEVVAATAPERPSEKHQQRPLPPDRPMAREARLPENGHGSRENDGDLSTDESNPDEETPQATTRMGLAATGRVLSTEGKPISAWRVEATYQISAGKLGTAGRTPISKSGHRYLTLPERTTAFTDAGGAFQMILSPLLASPGVLFTAYAPDGTAAGQARAVVRGKDQQEVRVEITVHEFTAIPLDSPASDQDPRPRRLTGRVFDLKGVCTAAYLQVIVWGKASQSSAARPIVVTRTNASGYFAEPYPEATFAEASATIATVAEPVPIPLVAGALPNPLLLGALLGQAPAKDGCKESNCSCDVGIPRTPDQWELTDPSGTFSADLGAGGCPRLNVPNRAVEEYDFYSVVRTTQPEIQGLTVARGLAGPSQPVDVTVRGGLEAANPVDWDSDPTFYQATSIAHGHLLHFKQVWYADGYSLGDLLYSLPLAPGQKRLIAVVDWDRRERAAREEGTFFTESLAASLERNRDLGEVISGALSENVRGGSRNTTAGVGVGSGAAANGTYEGINFGALVGISGGYGESNSEAWQNSSRNVSASSLQRLRDSTLQSASAVRGLRSTVVQTVGEGESATFSTEAVANHNRCHALTIQYFEVLRHLKITNELADVQECLFVPLPMSEFDRSKAIRWRESLAPYLKRPDLGTAFDAARRVQTDWAGTGTPAGRYADETVQSVRGELHLTVIVPLPPMPDPPGPDGWGAADAAAKTLAPTFSPLGVLMAVATGGASLVAGVVTQTTLEGARNVADSLAREPTPQQRYARFHSDVMPRVVAGFVDQLELYAVTGTSEKKLKADFTLVSQYSPGVRLLVGVRADVGTINRADISHLVVKSSAGLPDGCRAIVNDAVFRYRTASFEHPLVDDRSVNDDIDLPTINYPRTVTEIIKAYTSGSFMVTEVHPGSGAALDTPTDVWEQRNPREEDARQADDLVAHVNDNLEYYHHAIWWTMDPNRRFMLLDGFMIPSGQRSVASVVENRLIGIVGNSLIMPVARGVHLDPRFKPRGNGMAIDFLAYYQPPVPIPPARVSLPTRGVFAEAIMGGCNACERKDDSRMWQWEDAPLDEVPAIEPLSTQSRRSEPPGTTPTTFPAPVVSIQNVPAVPDPAGVRTAAEALGRQAFADITGLAGTQANAAAAYQQALQSAGEFGKEASQLAQQAAALRSIDKSMDAIDKAEESGDIDAAEAKSLRLSALRKMVGDGATQPSTEDVQERLDTVDRAVTKGSVSPQDARDLNRTVLQSYVGDGEWAYAERQAAAHKLEQLDATAVDRIELVNADGTRTFVGASGGGTSRRESPVWQYPGLETDWAKAHPEGHVEMGVVNGKARSDILVLWNFGIGSADVAKFTDQLARNIPMVKGWTDLGDQVLIEGATSVSGSEERNLTLGLARALAVKRWLVTVAKLPAAQLLTETQGEGGQLPDLPVIDGEGAARNRRVEMRRIALNWEDTAGDNYQRALKLVAQSQFSVEQKKRLTGLLTHLSDPYADDLYFNKDAVLWLRQFLGHPGYEWLDSPSRWAQGEPPLLAHMRDRFAALHPRSSDSVVLAETRSIDFLLLDGIDWINDAATKAAGTESKLDVLYEMIQNWIADQQKNPKSLYYSYGEGP
jgi:outer membrane protein OmpA-like peptidoglycan-associated protein